MFWSQINIPGKPRLLMVDASRDALGWEAEFCDRVFNVLSRKEIEIAGRRLLRVQSPQDLGEALQDEQAFNCILLFCHGQESGLSAYWDWLSKHEALSPKLLAVCTWEMDDPEAAEAILSAGDTFAQLAVVPQSPLSPRAAGLFFMKFFTELDLHAHDSMTGKMVWFSHSKAREILKRRHLPGAVGMRC